MPMFLLEHPLSVKQVAQKELSHRPYFFSMFKAFWYTCIALPIFMFQDRTTPVDTRLPKSIFSTDLPSSDVELRDSHQGIKTRKLFFATMYAVQRETIILGAGHVVTVVRLLWLRQCSCFGRCPESYFRRIFRDFSSTKPRFPVSLRVLVGIRRG